MADSSPLDVAGTIGGIATLLGVIGAAARWLFTRADSRADQLDRKEAALIKKMEERIAALEAKDEEREKEHAACQARVDKLAFFCVLMIEEGETINVISPTRIRAKRYLMREFPDAFGAQPPVPQDMTDMLDKLK